MTLLTEPSQEPLATLILAHGAGAGMSSDFMQEIASRVANTGIRVVRFNFPYMQTMEATQKRRPPDRMPVLLTHFEQVVADCDTDRPLFIGGKSMGGRVAATLMAQQPITDVRGVIALGYPFHPPGKLEKTRLEPLLKSQVPVMVVQGERDPFGKASEIAEYQLPDRIDCEILPFGDHSFKPPKSSGLNQQDNLATCATVVREFIGKHL